jgi:hypothetical protein
MADLVLLEGGEDLVLFPDGVPEQAGPPIEPGSRGGGGGSPAYRGTSDRTWRSLNMIQSQTDNRHRREEMINRERMQNLRKANPALRRSRR